jgi:disaggregatase-related protein
VIKRYLVALSVLCCGILEVCAEDADRFWRYDYFDGFDTTKAVTDSISHSVFNFQQTTLPDVPYLFYRPNNESSADRGLVFVSVANVPAHLEYRFPIDTSTETSDILRIGGTIDFDINLHPSPDESGTMFYRISVNGANWSPPIEASPGRNRIWPSSLQGSIYVRFEGYNVVLDNLGVHLRYGVAYHINNHVPCDVNNTGLNNLEPLIDLQIAINKAHSWDRIFVWPGVYTLQNTLQIQNKDILVQSIGEAAVLQYPGNYVVAFDNVGAGMILRNFVICNSYAGIFILFGNPTLSHLTIADNDTHAIHAPLGTASDISNCIFWNNPAGDLVGCRARYSRLSENTSSEQGNIRSNPLFADPNQLDYHLKSERGRFYTLDPNSLTGLLPTVLLKDNVNSPCIDAGDPNVFPMAELMPNGGRINMGAFGGTAWASLSVIPWLQSSDLNRDGIVNMVDYALAAKHKFPIHLVLQHWLWRAPWYDQVPLSYEPVEPYVME